MRRRGKQIIVEVGGELALLMHLMSAGRLQLFDRPRRPARPHVAAARARSPTGASCACASSAPSRRRGQAAARSRRSTPEESLARLGPEAWPAAPADLGAAARRSRGRCTRALRDQHVIAGIGRSWVDEILWSAQLSPFKRGGDLEPRSSSAARRRSSRRSTAALEHYERMIELPIPDKLPMPLAVHRHEGEPCPRCGDDARRRQLRGLRDELLPGVPDRRPRAQGPPAVAPAEVSSAADSGEELVDLVDADDRVIGTVSKVETDTDPSLIHREVAILVHRDGELLWQLRSAARP